MPSPMTAAEVLDREFLAARSRLIDVAAALDRIARSEGTTDDDPRPRQLRRAAEILADTKADKAERLQLLFSLPYQEDWQQGP
jgi:hypothetical protein